MLLIPLFLWWPVVQGAWDMTQLQSMSSNDAQNCYVALFDGECGSNGGVYKISESWYTGHFGGAFQDKRGGLGTCGNLIENWADVIGYGSHKPYADALVSKSTIGPDYATYVDDFSCVVATSAPAVDPSVSPTCPEGFNWGGVGLYCLGNDLYSCDTPGGVGTLSETCGAAGCVEAPAGSPDYCGDSVDTMAPAVVTTMTPAVVTTMMPVSSSEPLERCGPDDTLVMGTSTSPQWGVLNPLEGEVCSDGCFSTVLWAQYSPIVATLGIFEGSCPEGLELVRYVESMEIMGLVTLNRANFYAAALTTVESALTTEPAAGGWNITKLQSMSSNDAQNCYVALFDGECGTNGGVYKISSFWYTGHFGGSFADKQGGLGTCGNVIENWLQRSTAHESYIAALKSKSTLGDNYATYVDDFICGGSEGGEQNETTGAPVVEEVDGVQKIGTNGELRTAFSADGAYVTFTLTFQGDTWMGLGVTTEGCNDNNVCMVGADNSGTDIVVCDNTAGLGLHRYWVTAQAPVDQQLKVDLPVIDGYENSCQLGVDGVSTMVFTRSVDGAPAQNTRPVASGATMIYASDNSPVLAYHAERGAFILQGAAIEEKVPISMWLHMAFMALAWGLFLPFGVLYARYNRVDKGQPNWFKVHKGVQTTGWLLSLAGLVAAIVYKSNTGRHFEGPYAYHMIIGIVVVAVGFFQPLNAFVRPHPHDSIDPTLGCSDKRICWEYTHKGLGYGAIIFGAVNVCLGAYVSNRLWGEENIRIVASVLAGVFLGPLLLYCIFSEATGGKKDPPPKATEAKRGEDVPLKENANV